MKGNIDIHSGLHSNPNKSIINKIILFINLIGTIIKLNIKGK